MNRLSKNFVLALISILVVSGLLTVSLADVQAVSKPAVPQFSVQIVNHPYDVPPKTSTHPHTGETITQPGYRENNKSIEVTIKNQSFTPYTNTEGHKCNLYYKVYFKGHFEDEQNWAVFNEPTLQSDSQHTVVSKKYRNTYPVGTQLDFRVEAIIGYNFYRPSLPGDLDLPPLSSEFVVVASTLSNIQTFSVKDEDAWPSPSQSTTPPIVHPSDLPSSPSDSNPTNPTSPQDSWQFVLIIILVTVCIIIIPVVFVLFLSRQKKNQFSKDTVDSFSEVKMV